MPGALFVAVNKSGRIMDYEHMTPKVIYNMLAKRAIETGVKSFGCVSNELREERPEG